MAPCTHSKLIVGHPRCIHRRARIYCSSRKFDSLRSAMLIAEALLSPGRRRKAMVQICGVYKSSSFERSERSSNTYCLLAVAAQLTSLGAQTLGPTGGEGGRRRRGRIGRESNSFPSQPFLTPSSPLLLHLSPAVLQPFPVFLPVPRFSTVVLLQLVYIYLYPSWRGRSTYFTESG